MWWPQDPFRRNHSTLAYSRQQRFESMARMPVKIAVTKCPRTDHCANIVTAELQARGWTVVTYEADGAGGRALEMALQAGDFAASVELSLTELAAELLATDFGAGANRLTAAAIAEIPQVLVLGGLDAARSDSHQWTLSRPSFSLHQKTYIRTMPDENDRLGQEIAFKASAARAPIAIVAPRGGLSALDAPGAAFWDPQANAVLMASLRNWLAPNVQLVETAAHINSAECAAAIVEALVVCLRPTSATSSSSRP
jgi:uncharacterized protein (UPF0261 family)